MKRALLSFARVLGCLAALAAVPASARPPTDPSFTYQGQIKVAGQPLNGTADFIFTLHNASTGGSQVGNTLILLNSNLVKGLLTVDLDFGPGVFNGDGRWIQVQVRSPAGGGTYTTLTPRQLVLPAPYALYALNGNLGPQGATGPSGSAGATGATGP